MKTFRIAVIGSDGQLGTDLVAVLSEKHEVCPYTRHDFDILDKDTLKKRIDADQPTHVINTAAFHNINQCEENPEKSFLVNSIGAYNVARAASEVGAKVFYISTDYVFDGTKDFFVESDAPSPLNIYGASKLAGEHLTKIAHKDRIVIRTSALFGEKQPNKGPNFITRMLHTAREMGELSIVADQYTVPTYTYDFAVGLREMIEKDVSSGVYHLTSQGEASWHELVIHALKEAGISATVNIRETDLSARPCRPLRSVLRSEKLTKVGITALPFWQDAVSRYVKIITTP